MESILSLMLLSVMMLTVGSIINVSFRGLNASVEASRQNQNFVNESALDNVNMDTRDDVLSFENSAKGISTSVDVRVFSGDGFLSFSPGQGGS